MLEEQIKDFLSRLKGLPNIILSVLFRIQIEGKIFIILSQGEVHHRNFCAKKFENFRQRFIQRYVPLLYFNFQESIIGSICVGVETLHKCPVFLRQITDTGQTCGFSMSPSTTPISVGVRHQEDKSNRAKVFKL